MVTQGSVLAVYYERPAAATENPRGSANWILNELLRELTEAKTTARSTHVRSSPITWPN